MYEEDGLDLDGAGPTVAIVLPPLPPGVKFKITSTMIQLMNLKDMFMGTAGDDANQHLMNFVAICKLQDIWTKPNIDKIEAVSCVSFTGEATNWLNEIPVDSIRTWTEAWYTRDAEVGDLGYTFELFEDQDVDLDEDANYLENQGGFQNYNSDNQGYNSGNAGQNYSREGQYDRPANREQGNWQNRDGYRNDRSGRKNGSLPSDTIQNLKKDEHCMAIATRSGKVLTDPISAGIKYEQVLEQAGREEDKAEQKAEDRKFAKFITMLRQLSVNIPLVEALEQMPGYAKFMKDLVTKKRAVSINLIDNVHHCSAIATRSMVQKKEDPGAFTIPCTIRSIEFSKALCNLGANINLMLQAIYKQLGLGVPKPTAMRLMMADRSVKRPVGILFDVLVKVDTFIFPADFVILDCEVEFEVPIILGRPFLAIG
ncbi:hypothetical protein R3W88_014231 [Solanum pinnatisectum]|uniref:Retrotransposon gag domain-containing protein n=1 Tax=Solanum pinnatisectum TaxID=50273 RepID=A0AAV9KRU6_9SOLN|nr:hypothetical protein R3W88_014231 [Solanum pinnatisectum]